jgi:hypothetical protein
MTPKQERELQAVVRLLQQLPDPEPPEGMRERILSAVAEQEAHPGGLRRTAPWVGTALAAGLAAFALFASRPDLPLATLTQDAAATLTPTAARPVASATSTSAREQALRRPPLGAIAPVVVAGVGANFFDFGASATLPSLDGRPMMIDTARILERRLDHQINRLLLDPVRFFEMLGRRRDRDRLLAQIAERAAERGDAAQVALQLRQLAPGHPLGFRMTEALFESVSQQMTRR